MITTKPFSFLCSGLLKNDLTAQCCPARSYSPPHGLFIDSMFLVFSLSNMYWVFWGLLFQLQCSLSEVGQSLCNIGQLAEKPYIHFSKTVRVIGVGQSMSCHRQDKNSLARWLMRGLSMSLLRTGGTCINATSGVSTSYVFGYRWSTRLAFVTLLSMIHEQHFLRSDPVYYQLCHNKFWILHWDIIVVPQFAST